jgi:hypothetical protein
MTKPATKNTGPSVAARAKNIAPKVITAISGIRRAGSERLSMKTPIAVKIANTTAIPAASAVRTVEAASRPERNRTI